MTSEGERVDRLRYLMDNAVGADFLPPAWREIANAAPLLLDVVEAAREVLADEPWVHDAYGEDKQCFWCYADEGSVHADDCEWKRARAVLSALDSHLSAASERETPE